MSRWTGKSCRLSTMFVMTASFFLVEIIVGYITNSIALVADSFHMLSDVVALIVGFASVKISKWPSKRNTYGWVRAEVLGALVNAVFLLALCFSILVESFKRLVEVEEVDNPKLLIIVGTIGLLINVVGLFLFGGHGHSHGGGHGHSHGGHGHSHGGHGHSHKANGHSHADGDIEHDSEVDPCSFPKPGGESLKEKDIIVEPGNGTSSTSSEEEREIYTAPNSSLTIEIKKPKPAASMNMRGVFLHVLGDALGSVVVIISALIIWFGDGKWVYYVDPSMSILMVIIILSTTIPLLKESAYVLLQTVPSHLDVEKIIKELEKMEGIIGVHECHIWQLAGNRIIASAHVRCHDVDEYMSLAGKIKMLFHQAGIHSTTIQPEFLKSSEEDLQVCALLCHSEGDKCIQDTCCGPRKNNHTPSKTPNNASNNSNSNTVAEPLIAATSSAENVTKYDMKWSPEGDEVVLEMSHIKPNPNQDKVHAS